MCRRVVDGRRPAFVCAHPDLKRPLSPAEALAYSCNDFFVSLAPRLSREALNRTRMAAGLPPIAANTPMAPAIVGLDGPRTTPRALDRRAGAAGGRRQRQAGADERGDAGACCSRACAARRTTAPRRRSRRAGVSALAKTGTITDAERRRAGTGRGAHAGRQARPAASSSPPRRRRRRCRRDRRGRFYRAAHPGTDLAPAPWHRTLAPAAPRHLAPRHPSAPGTLAPIRLGRTLPDGRTRVETLAVDDYIAQVLAGEGQPRAGDAAQQALAITARTFALANRNRHRREGFDLCDTTHCQVLRPATAMTRRAAEATIGPRAAAPGAAGVRVLLRLVRRPVRAGLAGLARRDRLSRTSPSLEDEACEDEPGWDERGARRATSSARCARPACADRRLRDLRVLSRNTSDRVARIRVEGFTPSEMSGHEFRMAVGRVVGWQALKSTAFDVERTSSGYRFRGRGFGHGVGLCVIGAGHRAARGATADRHPAVLFSGPHGRRSARPHG